MRGVKFGNLIILVPGRSVAAASSISAFVSRRHLADLRRQRLIDSPQHLPRRQLVETLRAAREVAIAAFLLAPQARQRVLHQPHVAAGLAPSARWPMPRRAPAPPCSPPARSS